MNAYKCGRCSKYFDSQDYLETDDVVAYRYTYEDERNYASVIYLCVSCLASLQVWFLDKQKGV